MGMPAANAQSTAIATDTHIVMVPSPGGPVPTPLPHPFSGSLNMATVPTVCIGGQPAAVQGTMVMSQPPHIPTPPGTTFQKPPSNQGEVSMGSPTVFIGGKAAARNGDMVKTCNDPADAPVGQVVAAGTVFVG